MSDFESKLIGRILVENEVLFSTRVTSKHMGNPFAREVMKAIEAVVADGDEANIITVCDKNSSLQPAKVASLTSDPAYGDLKVYENKIISGYQTRKIKEMAEEATELAADPESALASIELHLTELTKMDESDRIYSARELLKPLIEQIEYRYHNRGQVHGIPTGFFALDNIITGLQPRRLYCLGARPSDGKSAFLLNMAIEQAVMGHSVGFISLESSKEELLLRNLSNLASIDSMKLTSGMLGPADFADIQAAASKIHDANIHFYDVPNINIVRLMAVAKMMKRKHEIKVLYVDYLQLIRVHGANSMRERIIEASNQLKNISRILEIPVIAAAQLGRDAQNRRPNMADFKESGQIEQDADSVFLLYPERDKEEKKTGRVWVLIDKNRDGPAGVAVTMNFTGKYTRFAEEKREDFS